MDVTPEYDTDDFLAHYGVRGMRPFEKETYTARL